MTVAQLMANLNEARWVRYDDGSDEILAWFGGHGIHVYNANGTEVQFFNVGDFSKNDASLEAVKEAMNDYIRGWGPNR